MKNTMASITTTRVNVRTPEYPRLVTLLHLLCPVMVKEETTGERPNENITIGTVSYRATYRLPLAVDVALRDSALSVVLPYRGTRHRVSSTSMLINGNIRTSTVPMTTRLLK